MWLCCQCLNWSHKSAGLGETGIGTGTETETETAKRATDD